MRRVGNSEIYVPAHLRECELVPRCQWYNAVEEPWTAVDVEPIGKPVFVNAILFDQDRRIRKIDTCFLVEPALSLDVHFATSCSYLRRYKASGEQLSAVITVQMITRLLSEKSMVAICTCFSIKT